MSLEDEITEAVKSATTPVYADNHSSTPIDKRVMRTMTKFMSKMASIGNPSSLHHEYGLTARSWLEDSRQMVANFINAEASENVIFTSGATEANNMAIFTLQGLAKHGRVICSPIEHKSVLEPINNSYETRLPIPFTEDMEINFDRLIKDIEVLKGEIDFISLMSANNEIGTIFQIREMGAIAKRFNIPFHVDASQSLAWMPIDVQKCNIDYLTISGHKSYGPKGVGALYMSDRVELDGLFFGGDQEFGKRVGTQNMPGIVGLAEAVRLCEESRVHDSTKIALIRSKMEKIFYEKFKDVDFRINGGKNRLPNNLSITFYGLQPGLLDLVNQKIAVSDGSACQSGTAGISHVLQAVGHTNESQTLRIGLGRFTKKSHAKIITDTVIHAVSQLK